LIFIFWIANWKIKDSAPNDSKDSLTSNCSGILNFTPNLECRNTLLCFLILIIFNIGILWWNPSVKWHHLPFCFITKFIFCMFLPKLMSNSSVLAHIFYKYWRVAKMSFTSYGILTGLTRDQTWQSTFFHSSSSLSWFSLPSAKHWCTIH